MIEQIMFFALGALCAALAGLVLLPLLWRRAARLTQERLEATLPLTPGDIAAERDQIRARFAVDIRRKETEVATAASALHRAKIEIGDKLGIIAARDVTLLERAARINTLESALDEARAAINALQASEERLTRERDNLSTTLDATRQTAQAQDEEATAVRLLSDQRQGRIGELEQQVDNLGARLADNLTIAAGLREDIQRRTDELRSTAQDLREQTSTLQSLERRVAAAQATAQDKTAGLEALQAERLRLIDDLGHATRERDHEKIERTALVGTAESLQRRVHELDAALVRVKAQSQQTITDLTRAADQLREERRAADTEMSTLRFNKAKLETDFERLKRSVEQADAATGEPVADVVINAPEPQPRPT